MSQEKSLLEQTFEWLDYESDRHKQLAEIAKAWKLKKEQAYHTRMMVKMRLFSNACREAHEI